jgi:hypothetical protein
VFNKGLQETTNAPQGLTGRNYYEMKRIEVSERLSLRSKEECERKVRENEARKVLVEKKCLKEQVKFARREARLLRLQNNSKKDKSTIPKPEKNKKQIETKPKYTSKYITDNDIMRAEASIEYLKYLFVTKEKQKDYKSMNEDGDEIKEEVVVRNFSLDTFLDVIYRKTPDGIERKERFAVNVGDELFRELDYWYYTRSDEYFDHLYTIRNINIMKETRERPHFKLPSAIWMLKIFCETDDGYKRKSNVKEILDEELFKEMEDLYNTFSPESKLKQKLEEARSSINSPNYNKKEFAEKRKYLLRTYRVAGEVFQKVCSQNRGLVEEVRGLLRI